MSLSFIVPARSQPQETRDCLDSILTSLRSNGLLDVAEFILLDDNSDPSHNLVQLFQNFRNASGRPAHIARFRKWQHYTGVFAYGLSKAAGDNVFFISNDMVVTPSWLRTILGVAALDRTFGVIRGTAEYVDSHPEHQFFMPYTARYRQDWFDFSEFIAKSLGLAHSIDPILSGDAVLVRRALIEKIGVMDRRFFGYFGDPDFGLRAQRAGFKLVCAKGAWLKHHGAGHIRADADAKKTTVEALFPERMALVNKAYERFREKWDLSMPPEFNRDTTTIDWPKLRAIPKPKGYEYIAPIGNEPDLVDIH